MTMTMLEVKPRQGLTMCWQTELFTKSDDFIFVNLKTFSSKSRDKPLRIKDDLPFIHS